MNGVRFNLAQYGPDLPGHAKRVGHPLRLVLWEFDALQAMNHHLHAVVLLNSRPKAFIVGPDNHVHLVPISNQATCKTLCKSSCAVDIWCKCVASDHNL